MAPPIFSRFSKEKKASKINTKQQKLNINVSLLQKKKRTFSRSELSKVNVKRKINTLNGNIKTALKQSQKRK